MVTTNVLDVLLDGTITKIMLSVENVLSLHIKRFEPDERFIIEHIDVVSYNEKDLGQALQEINVALSEHGVDALTLQDISGTLNTLNV